jgi:hypothetical protein
MLTDGGGNETRDRGVLILEGYCCYCQLKWEGSIGKCCECAVRMGERDEEAFVMESGEGGIK